MCELTDMTSDLEPNHLPRSYQSMIQTQCSFGMSFNHAIVSDIVSVLKIDYEYCRRILVLVHVRCATRYVITQCAFYPPSRNQ